MTNSTTPLRAQPLPAVSSFPHRHACIRSATCGVCFGDHPDLQWSETVAAADFISSAFGPSIHRRGSSTARAPPMKSWN